MTPREAGYNLGGVLNFGPVGEDDRLLGVGGCLGGCVCVPTSKSMAQRALLAACVARGTTRLTGLPEGADVLAALGLPRLLGVLQQEPGSDQAAVRGMPPGIGAGPDLSWMVGESGTLARCATALGALGWSPGTSIEIQGAGSLLSRNSPALMVTLDSIGVERQELGVPGGWPLRVRSVAPPEEVLLENPSSSQEVSALILALAAWPEPRKLMVRGGIPSRPYVDLTLSVLENFGVRVREESFSSRMRCFYIQGPLVAPEQPLAIEPDASAAAVALVAGCLSGGEARIEGLGLGSVQGDVRIVEHLEAFGCQAGENQVDGRPELWASGSPRRGATLDLSGEPDLAPVLVPLAAAAAKAGFASCFTGLGTLDGKESPRLTGLAQGLRACGFEVRAGEAELVVSAGHKPCPAPVLDAHGDHRMVFAFCLLGWVIPGLRVAGKGHVAKSWPKFLTDFEAAGADWTHDSGPS